ncbi:MULTISPECIES: J domain-containing protein [Pontibacillus]|uniref:DnaJ domain-containing protein n=1 Tax=Pontibacillus chungwhensis TaxID=265426 RepID=A0ABY8UWC9_9BACI|nr:DnaJ domain-containing protein [Pontibacillus chungwhensis]MCD5324152.1 DnaJ domain-containing protein [Pontibacillus sp. HN14]WIF97789.1 DnaJ domain-containing protein [Pontibacillus chungwhensis]
MSIKGIGDGTISTHYERLKIKENATQKEIKQAYFTLIRQVSNEVNQEEFQLVRESYEVLSDLDKKAHYDQFLLYGNDIEHLNELGERLYMEGDYEEAIRQLKKILLIIPGAENPRHLIARAYHRLGDYPNTSKHLNKLIDVYFNNSVYFIEAAYVYLKDAKVLEAKGILVKGLTHHSENLEYLMEYCDLMMEMQEYHQAFTLLFEKVGTFSEVQKSLVYGKLIEVSVKSRNKKSLEQVLRQFWYEAQKSSSREFEDRSLQTANKLFDKGDYEAAYHLTQSLGSFLPNHAGLNQLKNDAAAFYEFDSMVNHTKIIPALKRYFMYYLFSHELDEHEAHKQKDEVFDGLELSYRYEPREMEKSIKIIKIKYPTLALEREKLLNQFLNLCYNSIQTHTQYEQLKRDSRVIEPIFRLVALYLSNVEQSERTFYFNEILDALSEETIRDVEYSVLIVKRDYISLYELNTQFFDQLLNG